MNQGKFTLNMSAKDIFKERAKIANAYRDNSWYSALKKHFETDMIDFIQLTCWTLDPRLVQDKKNPHLPFILFPFQIDTLLWMEENYQNKKDCLIEKSRDMGASWIILTWVLYHFLFDNDFNALIGSKKEEDVDKKGSLDSLFAKIDYNITRLPGWILPKNFNLNDPKYRKQMLAINSEKRSIIQGETANANFSRQSRRSVVFVDEFAFVEYAQTIWQAMSATTPTRIIASTANNGSFMQKLRFSKKINIPIKTLHWRLDPRKDDEWYKNVCEKELPHVIATEYDISWENAAQGKVYEEFGNRPVGKYSYNPDLPLFTAWDYGLGDDTAIIWFQKDFVTRRVYVVDSYTANNKEIKWFFPFVTGKYEKDEDKWKYSDEERKQISLHATWNKPVANYGDPAGRQRNQVTNTSVIQELAKAGIIVRSNTKANRFATRRDATMKLIRRIYINEGNDKFRDAIINSKYPSDSGNSQKTTKTILPIHNFDSHFRSSLEYFAVCEPRSSKAKSTFNYVKKKNTYKNPDDEEDYKRKRGVVRYAFRKK